MKYEITGGQMAAAAIIKLNHAESVRIERGSMMYKTHAINIEGGMNGKGGGVKKLLSAVSRNLLGGESLFSTMAVSSEDEQEIGIAPTLLGDIEKLAVGHGSQWRLNTGVFLACDATVDLSTKSQKLSQGLFGGSGGLFILETTGEGDVLINTFGGIVKVEVTSEKPLTIDNEHVVAWDSNLDYSISVASGVFGFTTGEGLVNTFRGNGVVYVQTRNYKQFCSGIAAKIPKTELSMT